MKTISLIIAVTLVFGFGADGQNKKEKIKTYKVWVTLMDGSKEKGFFYKANEEGITINKSKTLKESDLISVEAGNIYILKIRRRGAVGKGAGIGFLVGAGAGAIGGYASGDDSPGWFSFSKEAKATGGAIFFGVIGAGTGAVVGVKKKKIIINGDLNAYKTHLNSLVNYDLIPD